MAQMMPVFTPNARAGKCQLYYHTFTSVETPKKFVFAPPGSHLLFTIITVNTDLAAIVLNISFNPLTFGNSLLASAVLRKKAIKLNPLMRGWVRACSECVNTCWLFPWELSRGTERRATQCWSFPWRPSGSPPSSWVPFFHCHYCVWRTDRPNKRPQWALCRDFGSARGTWTHRGASIFVWTREEFLLGCHI